MVMFQIKKEIMWFTENYTDSLFENGDWQKTFSGNVETT